MNHRATSFNYTQNFEYGAHLEIFFIIILQFKPSTHLIQNYPEIKFKMILSLSII